MKAKQADISTPHRAALSSLALLVALGLTAAPASAFETHLPLPFSPITGAGTGTTIEAASGVAIDEASGNVFLAEPLGEGVSAVDVFGADGGVPAGLLPPYRFAGLNNASELAVDNSAASPSRGTLYVTEWTAAASGRKVRKFRRDASTEQYEPVGELKAKSPAFTFPTSIAIDAGGNVFVGDEASLTSSIVKFGPTGTQLLRINTTLQTGNNSYAPRSLALDSSGDLFVLVSRVGNPGIPFTKVLKYPADGSGEILESNFDVFFNGENENSGPNDAYAIAVDPTTDTLYLALSKRIIQYDANTLAIEGEFGPDVIESTAKISRVAVNATTSAIYVSDNGHFGNGPRKITVFGPGVKLPTVTPEAPTKVVGPKATLNATVNPEGIAVTECKFEYGTTASYGSSVPCEGAIPTDTGDHSVTGALSGLTPSGVTYHFRISATSANGTNASPDQTFLSGPPAVTEAATGVTGAKATLHGIVLPQNLAVTDCKFEYGLTTAYGSSQPCLESVPTDEGEHAVTASIDHLLANGAAYHFRIAVDGDAGPVKGNDETLVTADTFATDPASVVGDSATLNGTVNLEGVPLTECKFEYGLTSAYGASTQCIPPFSSIPGDSVDHLVSGALTGLVTNASYHFRLVAENAEGKIVGADRSFATAGAPLIAEQSASPTGGAEAILAGWINPVGFDTSYHFEWGVDDSYGQRIPVEPDPSIGSGTVPVEVSEELSGLDDGTSYHFRLVAENTAGVTEGPDQTFTTERAGASCANAAIRAGQTSPANPAGTTYLPGCMALEMASPPKKFNQRIDSPNFSVDGDALQFISLAALAQTPQLGSQNDPYVATRSATGWATHAVQPPLDISQGDAPPCSYDLQLAHWSLLARPGVGAVNLGIVEPMSGGLGGSFSPLGPTVAPLNTTFEYSGCDASVGGSADGSAFFFRGEGAYYLPGDPVTTAKGTASSNNTYEAFLDEEGSPTIELLSRDASGTVYGGACGADVGWLGRGDRRAGRGAISPDGSRVYFTTRPSQPSGPCKPTENMTRVMRRIQTPAGPEIGELISPECTRVSPPCETADGDDRFMAASQEGDKVFFTSTRQLVDSDLDSGASCLTVPAAGCDLYLYDASQPVGSRLIQVSAGDATAPTPGQGADVREVADVAGDGSHAYFVATGLLTTNPNAQGARAESGKPNLYLYERDAAHPDGRTAFIATLGSGEGKLTDGPGNNDMAAVPRLGSDHDNLSVGGDGHVLFFSTKASLAPGDTDGKLDGYRYDADSGSLERITRATPGGSDNGPFDANGLFTSGKGRLPQDVSFRRTVSEDGRTAVFMTAEGLDPNDQDGKRNVYIWRDGRVTAIRGSLADSQGETFTVSMSGESVAFVTDAKLLPADGDGAKDIYVARDGGGFASPVPPIPCEGERCQEPFLGQPAIETAPSETTVDAGNLPPPPPKCRRGFVRKHGKCVKRPGGKKAAHKANDHRKAQKRHAKTNRGAGK